MDERPGVTLARDQWAPLFGGFRKHGIIGKVYIVFHLAVALLLLTVMVLGFGGSTRTVLTLIAVVAIALALAVGVALHRRLVITTAFALSVVGFMAGLYEAARVLRQPVPLAACLVFLALSALFVWYFGRLQYVGIEAGLASDAEGTPPEDGAA